MSFCGIKLQLLVECLVHSVLLAREYGHAVEYVHCFWVKSHGLGYPIFVTGKESWWDMVSKTMMYMTAMTLRCAIGWWKPPCGVVSHLYQSVSASWKVWVGWDSVAY